MRFTTPVAVAARTRVDISADGHAVTFDGGNGTQLFVVSDGTLTLTGLVLQDAAAAWRGPPAAAPGAPGADGDHGSDGAGGWQGGEGEPGGNGARGKAGRPGSAARGGAIWVKSGSVTLDSDVFDDDDAVGGPGGAGGGGGSGGAGGAGGNGGNGVTGVGLATAATAGRRQRWPGRGRGSGGGAYGGAVYSAGSLTLIKCVFASDWARGRRRRERGRRWRVHG